MLKKDVRMEFDPSTTPREEVVDLLQSHAEDGNIGSDYEIEEDDSGHIYAHFDVSENVEHPDRFMFTAFTPYAEQAWHDFD